MDVGRARKKVGKPPVEGFGVFPYFEMLYKIKMSKKLIDVSNYTQQILTNPSYLNNFNFEMFVSCLTQVFIRLKCPAHKSALEFKNLFLACKLQNNQKRPFQIRTLHI